MQTSVEGSEASLPQVPSQVSLSSDRSDGTTGAGREGNALENGRKAVVIPSNFHPDVEFHLWGRYSWESPWPRCVEESRGQGAEEDACGNNRAVGVIAL